MYSKLPQQVRVVASIAERYYGVSAWSVWDEKRDKGRQKDWDELEGCHRTHTMTWFIKKVSKV